jgi:probable rRNA maturation factor
MTKVYYENLTDKVVPESCKALMKRVVRTCIEAEYPAHKLEVFLTVCDDEHIKELNRQHRGKDTATDVLSFPFFDFDTPEITTMLGDIIISIERAAEQSASYGHSLKRELCFLAAHAALHLLGYDHEGDEQRAEMEKKQRELLEKLSITRED